MLSRLREDGVIPAGEGSRSRLPALPAMVAYEKPRRDIGFHFVDQVAREAKALAGIEAITANSYTVRSTISPSLQRATEAALQEGLWRYERNAGRLQFRGPEANLANAVKRIEAEKKPGDKAPAWQRALANVRLPLYDVHWPAAIIVEKPSGKKGEAWRVGLADGRILPLALENGAAQRKLALYDVVFVRVMEGGGQDCRTSGAATASDGSGRRGGAGEQDGPCARDGGGLLLSAEPAQPRDSIRAPARLDNQATELSRGAG